MDGELKCPNEQCPAHRSGGPYHIEQDPIGGDVAQYRCLDCGLVFSHKKFLWRERNITGAILVGLVSFFGAIAMVIVPWHPALKVLLGGLGLLMAFSALQDIRKYRSGLRKHISDRRRPKHLSPDWDAALKALYYEIERLPHSFRASLLISHQRLRELLIRLVERLDHVEALLAVDSLVDVEARLDEFAALREGCSSERARASYDNAIRLLEQRRADLERLKSLAEEVQAELSLHLVVVQNLRLKVASLRGSDMEAEAIGGSLASELEQIEGSVESLQLAMAELKQSEVLSLLPGRGE